MPIQIQESEDRKKTKLSQILKNAVEGQCFGSFMKISKIIDVGEDNNHQITSSTLTTTKTVLKLCVNGLLMSKAGIGDESSTLSIYNYVADEADILNAYRSLGIDPYYRIKCNRCKLFDNGYHLYRILEHMNDHHRASFKEIGSYLETVGL
ncbi:MAG: hypothetical protein M3250_05980 [Thermoproteota archaeon]|nr:hypothetical protein [Thermoproteota archaeon]